MFNIKGWKAWGRMLFGKTKHLTGFEKSQLIADAASPIIIVVALCALLYGCMGFGLVMNTVSLWVIIIILAIEFEYMRGDEVDKCG